jgi:hypothetical protein
MFEHIEYRTFMPIAWSWMRIELVSMFSHVPLTSRRHAQMQQQLRATAAKSRPSTHSQQNVSASPSGLATTATTTAARATKRVKRMTVSGRVVIVVDVRAAATDAYAC